MRLPKIGHKEPVLVNPSDFFRYDDDAGREDEDKEGSKSPGAGGEGAAPEPERYNEQPQEEVQVPETRIDVEVPKITTDLGKEMFFVKLPNFLSVECRSVKFKTGRKFRKFQVNLNL